MENQSDTELRNTITRLNDTLSRLPDDYPHVFYLWKSVWFSFLRGAAYGVGFVIALALLIPLVVIILRMVEWAPFVGGLIELMAERIEQARHEVGP